MSTDLQTSPRRAALVAALRRSAVLLVVLALTGAGLGLLAGLQRAEEHTAEASILVAPLDGNPFYPGGRGDELVNLETEAQLVASDQVARNVAARIGYRGTASQLLSGLDVRVPSNTQILAISYTGATDEQAVRRAQAFADAYLDYRSVRSQDVVESRSGRIQSQIDSQGETLQELVAAANEATGAERRVLQERITGVSTQISQLRVELAELQSGSVDPGQVITPATSVGQNPITSVAAFAVLGMLGALVLALSIVVLRARAENRIHHAADVAASGLPLLGAVTAEEVAAGNEAATTPGAPVAATGSGFQTLRVTVLARERRRPVRLLYAPAASAATTPQTALGLAYSAAASRLTTVLVDATGEPDGLSAVLGLEHAPGFTEILIGEVEVDEAVTSLSDHLMVVPAGRKDTRVDDMLTGPRIGSVFDHLEKGADIVVVATRAMDSARAKALAMVTDTTVVEAVDGQTRLGELLAVGEEATVGNPVLGVVFVAAARTRQRSRSTAG